MYKSLFVVLVLSGICSTFVVIYQLLVTATSKSVDEHWRTWWIWDAFWHVLYFFVLAALAFLWRPTSNNTRYAFVELKEGDEEDDEENGISLVPMTSLGEMTQRTRSSSFSEEDVASITAPLVEPEPEKPAIVPNFTLETDQDDEESKTENSKLN